jgi:hypothetical protein
MKFGSKEEGWDLRKDLDPGCPAPSVFTELLCTVIDHEAYVV